MTIWDRLSGRPVVYAAEAPRKSPAIESIRGFVDLPNKHTKDAQEKPKDSDILLWGYK